MLIPSHRHTPADLRLWAEYEEADTLHGQRPQLTAKVERSIAEIKTFAAAGPCYCSVSWGKDSVAVAALVYSVAPETTLVNIRAKQNRNEGCDIVRDLFLRSRPMRLIEHDVDYPGHSEKEIDKAFFGAFRKVESDLSLSRYISGLKACESGGRAIRFRKAGLTLGRSCGPLGWWSVADVFGYCAANDLPLHPNYAMLGGGRYERMHLRQDDLGDPFGAHRGRAEWEREYYGDVLNRLAASPPPPE